MKKLSSPNFGLVNQWSLTPFIFLVDINLAVDTFRRIFTDVISTTAQTEVLPNFSGNDLLDGGTGVAANDEIWRDVA